jgi:hypothetical protein
MANTTLSSSQSVRRFNLKALSGFLFHPRQNVASMMAEGKPAWLMPMLAVSVSFLLSTIVGGFLRARAAAMGQTTLPVDWQWWSPDMQTKYMQAIQATQGPVFVYIIPIVTGLAKLWLVWAIISGLLHLFSTLLGGRGAMAMALNIAAWSSLPFFIRDLLRIVFMLIVKAPIASPGLSGLTNILFLSKLLANVDLFMVWYAVLLAITLVVTDKLSKKKAALAVVIVLAIVLLAQAGLGALSASLGGMMISRPF